MAILKGLILMLPYRQEISVEGWKDKADFSKKCASKFFDNLNSGLYPALSLVEERDDLGEISQSAQDYKDKFDAILILGTGGSSLGAQTLASLKYSGCGLPQSKPALYFMDNIDPFTFQSLFSAIDLKKTGVIAISKSGSTAETLCQLLICLEHWQSKVGESRLREHFTLLTEYKDSPLYRLGQRYGLKVLEHHSQVGGRFSVFSNVGGLPALLAGLDFAKIREGAAKVLKSPQQAIEGASVIFSLYKESTISNTVVMPYLDRLINFSAWFRQLWAESLGKNGVGLTPINALGTVDQHSQTQLYLDGPRDKFFTFIVSNIKGQGEKVTTSEADLGYLNHKTMGDLLEAEQRATIQSLREKGCPLRILHIDSLNEASLGALLMHYMIETIVTAELLGINAFDQPAVERGKILTREYLAELER